MWQKRSLMTRFRLAGILALSGLILLVSVSGAISANQENFSGNDVDVRVEGNGIIERVGQTVTVWESEPVMLFLGPTQNRAGEHYIYCLDTDEVEYGCQQDTLEEYEDFEFEIPASDLSRGQLRVNARIYEDNLFSNELIETVSFELEVISRNADEDNDGLDNQREINLGTEYDNPDSDDDGLDDGVEVNQYNTDPQNDDTDYDGLDDRAEVNRYNTDPLDDDTDRDGLSDEAEVLEYGTDPTTSDTDSDGLDDGAEVNEHGTDPSVADTDGDGFDDGAEIRQGSNPNDTDDTPRNDETNQPDSNEDQTDAEDGPDESNNIQPNEESSAEDKSSDEEEEHRGFFTNNPDSGIAVLQNPLNITVLGFLLSIAGIFLQLRRGV